MSYNGKRVPHRLLGETTRRAGAAGVRLARRLKRLVLKRAVKKAARSIKRRPSVDRLLRDIGLTPAEAERLASELQILATDPMHITMKPHLESTKPKPRPR